MVDDPIKENWLLSRSWPDLSSQQGQGTSYFSFERLGRHRVSQGIEEINLLNEKVARKFYGDWNTMSTFDREEQKDSAVEVSPSNTQTGVSLFGSYGAKGRRVVEDYFHFIQDSPLASPSPPSIPDPLPSTSFTESAIVHNDQTHQLPDFYPDASRGVDEIVWRNEEIVESRNTGGEVEAVYAKRIEGTGSGRSGREVWFDRRVGVLGRKESRHSLPLKDPQQHPSPADHSEFINLDLMESGQEENYYFDEDGLPVDSQSSSVPIGPGLNGPRAIGTSSHVLGYHNGAFSGKTLEPSKSLSVKSLSENAPSSGKSFVVRDSDSRTSRKLLMAILCMIIVVLMTGIGIGLTVYLD